MTTADVARGYARRGWSPVPIQAKSKRPTMKGWEKLQLAESEVASHFRGTCNVGVLLGEPSNWLVDVDLDDPLAVELADEFLPATGAEFGRAGKPRSHRLYYVTALVETVKRQTKNRRMIAELRSSGCQTVFPGSVHPSGERIEWSTDGEPAKVAPGFLLSAFKALADEVERRLSPTPKPAPSIAATGDVVYRARNYLAKIPPAVSGQGGHVATFHAACCLVQGFALERDIALILLAEWNESCVPPWTNKELAHKVDDALKLGGDRGYLLNGHGKPRQWSSDSVPTVALDPILTCPADVEPRAVAWPEVVSFDVLDLPDFPTGALPDVLRQWVEAESHATQTPADLAALLALAVCSACIARRVVVEPRPGWHEPVNLFTAVLLEPGNRKSAVFADALKPLRELEAELIESARPTVARAQSDRRQDEARLRKLEKTAAEKHGDEAAQARHEAGKLAAELAEQTEPVLPRSIVDDATAEKLGMMLAEQGGRIASMSPEGGVFDLMAGLYSKSGIPQFGVYLMAHSGDDLITDRVSRKSVRVERPALTCAYAMQPAVIEGLAENAAFRGRGLLARFLYAAPRSWIGRREIAPTPVSVATREAYRKAVRALADSFGNSGSALETFALQLTADAEALLREWEAEIEAMLSDGGQMEIMRDWGAKLAGATLRLSAVLHCVEHGPAGRIGAATIAAAVEIARYLIPHAETVLNMMSATEDPTCDNARYLLRWIERHGRREFTKSEAQHHGKRRFPKADDIDPALVELMRRGYIRPQPVEATGPGRPPSPTYEVNPAAFADAKPNKRSHNSRNSAYESENGHFGNNGSASEQSESHPGGEWGEV